MIKKSFYIFCALVVTTLGAGTAGAGEGKTMPPLKEKKVLMIIASRDFRDEEFAKPREVLTGQGAQVVVASSSLAEAEGMLGMKTKADLLIDSVNVNDYDGVIFVGGSGASEFWEDGQAHHIARECFLQEKILGAICIAPVTLAKAGLLQGMRATVFPSEKSRLKDQGALYTGKDVEKDRNIITASGPQAALEFGKAVARALGGR